MANRKNLREKKISLKHLLLENVDRLLKFQTQRGRDFVVMLASLNKLNYAVEWRVINAADYGFLKDISVFIIGYLKGASKYKDISEKFKTNKIVEWIDDIGTLAKAFKVEEISDGLIKFNLIDRKQSIKTIGDLELVSKSFGKHDTISKFKNAGVALNGKVYTYHTSN